MSPWAWKLAALAIGALGLWCVVQLARVTSHPFWPLVRGTIKSSRLVGSRHWDSSESRTVDNRCQLIDVEYHFAGRAYLTSVPNSDAFRDRVAGDPLLLRVCPCYPRLIWADPFQQANGACQEFRLAEYLLGVTFWAGTSLGALKLASILWTSMG